jgi:hypothetical protein
MKTKAKITVSIDVVGDVPDPFVIGQAVVLAALQRLQEKLGQAGTQTMARGAFSASMGALQMTQGDAYVQEYFHQLLHADAMVAASAEVRH